MQMPGGVPGGGMVRVGIERDITWRLPAKKTCSFSDPDFGRPNQ